MSSSPERLEPDSSAFMSALVTEHFVLQSLASSTISESGSRSALYLSTLSSGLVAIGFASSNPAILAALAFTVFPTIFLLGCFTVVRLVDTSIENITAQERIELIRRHYASLHPTAPSFFVGGDDPRTAAMGVRYSAWSILFTMASMVGVVNSVLAGAAAALALSVGTGTATTAATGVGVLIGLLVLTVTLEYQRRRFTRNVTDVRG